jgi:hypothetical protein
MLRAPAVGEEGRAQAVDGAPAAAGECAVAAGTTGRAPGLHFESELAYLRPVPEDISLRDVFLHRALRLVRKNGCVSLDGVFYEVPGDLVGEHVELRHDPRRPDDLPLIFHHGAYRDVARRLDLHANANGRRRALPTSEAAGDDLEIDAIGLIADEYYRTLHGAPNRNRDDDSEDGAA